MKAFFDCFTFRPLYTILTMTVMLVIESNCLAEFDRASAPIGRWDLQMQSEKGSYPSWLEIRLSGNSSLVGSFVGQFGSARPIAKIETVGEQLRFVIPPQWEKRSTDQSFLFSFKNNQLRGTTSDENGETVTWTGRRAPLLKRDAEPKWGTPIELFNGVDLSGWETQLPDVPNGWVVRDGRLSNQTPGNNLVTKATFHDFKLQAEFRYPQGSNSGIYLRGRYELQIEDNYGDEPESHKIGGVYGFLTPSSNASKPAGEWQTYEVTLIGRTLTVFFNGQRIIDRQAIPGITGGAIDSDEGAPGPILLQGDHGPIEFRKLVVIPSVAQ